MTGLWTFGRVDVYRRLEVGKCRCLEGRKFGRLEVCMLGNWDAGMLGNWDIGQYADILAVGERMLYQPPAVPSVRWYDSD